MYPSPPGFIIFHFTIWKHCGHSQKYNSSIVSWIHNLAVSLVNERAIPHPDLSSKYGFLWNWLFSGARSCLWVQLLLHPSGQVPVLVGVFRITEQGCCRTLPPEYSSHQLHQFGLLGTESFGSVYGDGFLSLLLPPPVQRCPDVCFVSCECWQCLVSFFWVVLTLLYLSSFPVNFRL